MTSPPQQDENTPAPATILAAINDYYSTRQDLTDLIGKYSTNENKEGITRKAQDLDLNKDKDEDKSVKMPVHPIQNQGGDLTDKIAKESSDSTASDHKIHEQAHKANPGPVIAENIGKPASKEELKKRSEELNK